MFHLLGYNLPIAVAVGFIALAGVAVEFGVIMLVYLDNALADARRDGHLATEQDLNAAIKDGAVLRIRPKGMTVATLFAGLLPIMLPLGEWGGIGSEVMRPIAAPMVGGMVTAPLLSLFVLPAI